MLLALVTGAIAGALLGYVLQRGQLCFHSMFATAWEGRLLLLRGWALGVAIASVGLSVLYLTPWGDHGINRGLPFFPVSDLVGGVTVGVGMVIARSCVSGMFYKLGSGMLGAVVGLFGWGVGEWSMRNVLPLGPMVLDGQQDGTVAHVLHLPRLLVSAAVLGGVLVVLRLRPGTARPAHRWQWGWGRLGVALGAATIAGWLLARAGHATYGPSTVGAVASVAAGAPQWWLIGFLAFLVVGGSVAARTAGGWWVRGEHPLRYVGLLVGGWLLGAGGWLAGGCNLGHGLSGVAQLNVSSYVVVAAMAGGVGAGHWVERQVRGLLSAGRTRTRPTSAPA